MMPVAVLCGGRGTRLDPLTRDVPKYLVEVAGKPFAWWQLKLLRQYGYKDFVFLTGHLGNQIKRYIEDGKPLGISATYSDDPQEFFGADFAIKRALPLLGPEFFVIYGDSYLECDYAAIEARFRRHPEADALLTFWDGVDYGLRAFRRFPPRNAIYHHMDQPFKEIGSHDGLEKLRAELSARNRCDR